MSISVYCNEVDLVYPLIDIVPNIYNSDDRHC